MRRCYRGVALVLGAILLASNTLSNSCRLNIFDVYAAEDTLANDDSVVSSNEETPVVSDESYNEEISEEEILPTEEPKAEIQTGEENVETEIPADESVSETEEVSEEKETNFKLEYNDYNVLIKIVEAEAGVSLIYLSSICMKNSLDLSFASGIPGQVGASTAMNAGAYNEDLGMYVKEVEVITPSFEIIRIKRKDLDFKYRDSFLKQNKDYIYVV